MSEAGRHRPASGFEISDALRGRVHSYGEETRSVLCEERMGETTRTQQQQHLSSSLSFMQVNWYPSGQRRVMFSMVGPPFCPSFGRNPKSGFRICSLSRAYPPNSKCELPMPQTGHFRGFPPPGSQFPRWPGASLPRAVCRPGRRPETSLWGRKKKEVDLKVVSLYKTKKILFILLCGNPRATYKGWRVCGALCALSLGEIPGGRHPSP